MKLKHLEYQELSGVAICREYYVYEKRRVFKSTQYFVLVFEYDRHVYPRVKRQVIGERFHKLDEALDYVYKTMKYTDRAF